MSVSPLVLPAFEYSFRELIERTDAQTQTIVRQKLTDRQTDRRTSGSFHALVRLLCFVRLGEAVVAAPQLQRQLNSREPDSLWRTSFVILKLGCCCCWRCCYYCGLLELDSIRLCLSIFVDILFHYEDSELVKLLRSERNVTRATVCSSQRGNFIRRNENKLSNCFYYHHRTISCSRIIIE